MKKIYIVSVIVLITVIAAVAGILNETGRACKTGSPGEFDCTGCHTSFQVNSGPGSISITSSNLTNWEYVPGQTYHISVAISQTNVPLFGFGFEVLKTSNNTSTGTFTITNRVETQTKSAIVNGASRANVVQKKNGGLTSNSHTFNFDWTAPTTNVGNIKFYTAGNASDNQQDSLNDYVYTTSQLVTPLGAGIEDVATESPKIYFNSVTGKLTVEYLHAVSAQSEILIYDLSGKNIFRKSFINQNKLLVDVSSFADGIYVAAISSGDKFFRNKFLKQ
jgi:hypothetical protein